jgi:hypothetical protein
LWRLESTQRSFYPESLSDGGSGHRNATLSIGTTSGIQMDAVNQLERLSELRWCPTAMNRLHFFALFQKQSGTTHMEPDLGHIV